MSREACRVAPPSGLRVNPKSAVPVHAQLMTQIRHFISTGTRSGSLFLGKSLIRLA
jgi:hypothetical protein